MSIETTVRDILKAKKIEEVKTINPDDSVLNALKIMDRHNIGALVVTENKKILGLFSERDYARKVALKNRGSNTTKVHEIMESKVFYVLPTDTAEECMALMTAKRIRHLPVMEDQTLVGLVSIGDIVKAVVEDRGFLIEQLICYATGSYTGHAEYNEPKIPELTHRTI